MSLVRRGIVTLSLEDMAKMPTAVGTDNFRPFHAKSPVSVSSYGSRDAIKVGRPSATR